MTTTSEPETLQYKPDWARVRERWIAWWDGANDDRPLLDVRARRPGPKPPAPQAASLEALYFDPDYVAATWLRQMEMTWFGGEGVPVGGYLMGGYALGCGPGVVFAPNTVWHPVLMKSIRDPFGLTPPAEDPWTKKMEAVLGRLLDLASGRFLVGNVCQVMANDLLALLRGSEDFLRDMAEDLDLCVRRLEEMLQAWIAIFEHFRAVVSARQAGCVMGWPGLWHPWLALTWQSDMSCMISAPMFERYVLHEMDLVQARYGAAMWYHVDGPRAFRHVPALLTRPYLRCLQIVPGAGHPENGPAHLDLYRAIQAGGRGLDLHAPWENVEYLLRHLRPGGVIIRANAPSIEQAEELIAHAATWAGSDAKTN